MTWPVERDEDFIERMYWRVEDFWEHVVHGVEPEILPPEGTVDLSDCEELVKAFNSYAKVDWDTKDFRGIIDRRDAHKKRVKAMIERELALSGAAAKRVEAGGHKATLVEREHSTSWVLIRAGRASPLSVPAKREAK